jgi:predicted glycosyltransferase
VLTGVSGISASHVGALLGKPSVIWDDTEHQKQIHLLTWPSASVICSPDCYTKSAGKKHRFYPGLHELAYLHPDRFKPDTDIVKSIGLDLKEKYCIIRMVSWGASHDVGHYGMAEKEKLQFVKEIAHHVKPYITSEAPLSSELRPYQLKIPVHFMHHVLAFASLCVTEGGTVASEAAVLGIPTLYINTQKMGYINMLEEYGLIKQSKDTKHALKLSLELLNDENSSDECQKARGKLLEDKIDVTRYIVEKIEEYGM